MIDDPRWAHDLHHTLQKPVNLTGKAGPLTKTPSAISTSLLNSFAVAVRVTLEAPNSLPDSLSTAMSSQTIEYFHKAFHHLFLTCCQAASTDSVVADDDDFADLDENLYETTTTAKQSGPMKPQPKEKWSSTEVAVATADSVGRGDSKPATDKAPTRSASVSLIVNIELLTLDIFTFHHAHSVIGSKKADIRTSQPMRSANKWRRQHSSKSAKRTGLRCWAFL